MAPQPSTAIFLFMQWTIFAGKKRVYTAHNGAGVRCAPRISYSSSGENMANPVTLPNPIKELFKQDKIALGMNVRLARSGDIAGIAKSTGHDFIFIDMQHSLYNVETVGHIALAALGVGIAPLARVSGCDDPQTQ